jgi:hypothetical protein
VGRRFFLPHPRPREFDTNGKAQCDGVRVCCVAVVAVAMVCVFVVWRVVPVEVDVSVALAEPT